METKTINREPVSYNAAELTQKTRKGLIPALQIATESKNRLLVDGKELAIDPFDILAKHTSQLENALMKCSKKSKKKLLNRLRGLEYGFSLKKINIFLHFLKTKVLLDQTIPTFKFLISSQEQEIVDVRVKYKASKAETEKLRQEYKTKKRVFYPQGKRQDVA